MGKSSQDILYMTCYMKLLISEIMDESAKITTYNRITGSKDH